MKKTPLFHRFYPWSSGVLTSCMRIIIQWFFWSFPSCPLLPLLSTNRQEYVSCKSGKVNPGINCFEKSDELNRLEILRNIKRNKHTALDICGKNPFLYKRGWICYCLNYSQIFIVWGATIWFRCNYSLVNPSIYAETISFWWGDNCFQRNNIFCSSSLSGAQSS